MNALVAKAMSFVSWRTETVLPEPEAFRFKPRPMTGFFPALSEEGKSRALACEDDEAHGEEEFRYKKAG